MCGFHTAYAWRWILVNNFVDFRDVLVKKKNQDFVQSLVVFRYSNIWYWSLPFFCSIISFPPIDDVSFWYIFMFSALLLIIHPIHRFKSSDWLKEGHMTRIIFDNVHIWKLIHVC